MMAHGLAGALAAAWLAAGGAGAQAAADTGAQPAGAPRAGEAAEAPSAQAPPPAPAPAPAPGAEGAAAPDAAPEPPAEAAQFPLVRLELRASRPDVDFYWKATPETVRARAVVRFETGRFAIVRGDPLRYVNLCTAPCEARLPRGPIQVSLSTDQGRTMLAESWDLKEPVRVEGQYVSRRWLRLAGLGVMIAGAGVGLGFGLDSQTECDPVLAPGDEHTAKCRTFHPNLLTGLIIAGAAVVAGTPFLFIRDRTAIEVKPAPSRAP